MLEIKVKEPSDVADNFYYWSKLLAGNLIVHIIVYADDSGTHSLAAKEKGSEVAVLAGYVGFADDWVNFCGRWQTTLNEFKVPNFHFSEFVDKKNRSNDKDWYYFGWSEERRHEFLFKLASIAGSRSRFPIGASFRLAHFHSDPEIKPQLRAMGLTDEQINGPYLVYLGLFADFYELFFKELKFHHPDFDDSISFTFDDRKGDTFWKVAAHEMHNAFKNKYPKLIAPTFGNPNDHVPLQAADMVAYRFRQLWGNEWKNKVESASLDISRFTELDFKLWGNFKGADDFKNHMQNLLDRNAKLKSK